MESLAAFLFAGLIPPDYIFFVEWYEYRAGYFGRGYGITLMQWIQQNYHPVELIGSEPFRDGAFGIKILKRNSLH